MRKVNKWQSVIRSCSSDRKDKRQQLTAREEVIQYESTIQDTTP